MEKKEFRYGEEVRVTSPPLQYLYVLGNYKTLFIDRNFGRVRVRFIKPGFASHDYDLPSSSIEKIPDIVQKLNKLLKE